MKRKENTEPVKAILNRLISAYGKPGQLDELEIREAFNQQMGNAILKHVREIRFFKGTLTIFTDSSVLKHELSYGKATLIQNINEALNRDLIKEIVVR
jgi:hypothetical protein